MQNIFMKCFQIIGMSFLITENLLKWASNISYSCGTTIYGNTVFIRIFLTYKASSFSM